VFCASSRSPSLFESVCCSASMLALCLSTTNLMRLWRTTTEEKELEPPCSLPSGPEGEKGLYFEQNRVGSYRSNPQGVLRA
jgi:hypothetical protein